MIQDIKVQGEISSKNQTPYIPGQDPLITWEYDGSVFNRQVGAEIVISSSSTNWGTDNLVGDILQFSDVLAANNYQLNSFSLQRGQKYYCQIRVTDIDNSKTRWEKFTFQVNRLPFLTGIVLTPQHPTVNDNISVSYSFHDPDQHNEFGTIIRWFRNNLPVDQYNGLCTLPASATKSGDFWSAIVVPSDGLEFGTIYETSAISIADNDIAFNSIKILPISPNVDDIFKVEWELIDDEYIFTNAHKIEWYINDQLVNDSDRQFIRLSVKPGDIVYSKISILDEDFVVAIGTSPSVTILDVLWHIYDVEVNGQKNVPHITSTSPILEWQVQKTTAKKTERPELFRLFITKTESNDGSIFDTGVVEYTKNSFVIPDGILSRGQNYFIHIGIGDEQINEYVRQNIQIAGSSWQINVDNNRGWTIEFELSIASGQDVAEKDPEPNLGIYIHDGTYFCVITFFLSKIVFLSQNTVTYVINNTSNFQSVKTVKISGKNTNIRVFLDGQLIIDGVGAFISKSNLKQIEIGDLDTKNINYGVLRFLRYSTAGADGLDPNMVDKNTFYFYSAGQLRNGNTQYIFDNIISWLPDDPNESAKLIQFNPGNPTARFPTVNRNFSPITTIHIDKNRNKFIGTANGVTAIYGDKHDPDFMFDYTEIPNAFDRITNVPKDKIIDVESTVKENWFSINTTYRTVGIVDPSKLIETDDEYDPYTIGFRTHAIHYFSQRTHGHAWYDNVKNMPGWQIQFAFQLGTLEGDDFNESGLDKNGFGIYVNDGTYQEIIYFFEDRIRLFYANVYVPINTQFEREYTVVGKNQNLKIYQRLKQSGAGGFQLLLDGSGLFTTPSDSTGNSRKPKVAIDNIGFYHCVWHDDNNKQSQIFYSKFDGAIWSAPESIHLANFNVRNPVLDIDSHGRIWVAYEDTSWGQTEISISVRDKAGWNPKTRITNIRSDKGNPDIRIDTFDNVHVVWEDNRNGHPEIFWCRWDSEKQAWNSSAQSGDDLSVMQSSFVDEYSLAVSFKNPKISLLHPSIWLVCEGHAIDADPVTTSSIYVGNLNIETESWNGANNPISQDGEVVSFGSPILISDGNRKCVNPEISSSSIHKLVVIVWEDQTEPISQIWGAVLSPFGTRVNENTQITLQNQNCHSPTIGFIGNHALIIFVKNGAMFASHYNVTFQEFHGSDTGSTDRYINTLNKKVSYPSLPSLSISKNVITVYDFINPRDPNDVSSIEFPDFQLIGDVLIEHSSIDIGSPLSTTTTVKDGQISSVDTKEFAFGDFSDNVGMIAHWQDIKMYFGYDALPVSISKFNTNTVSKWIDNRITDLFVDVYGNLIVGTFGGLLYHNTITGQTTNIQGLDDNNVPLLKDKLITIVKWGKNGVWYVGTTAGLFCSSNAGRTWTELNKSLLTDKIINTISVNKDGHAVCGTRSKGFFNSQTDGIYITHLNTETPVFIKTSYEIKIVAIDDNNIIWAGGNQGLLRIENNGQSVISFNKTNGMKSSHVNDISIVNKHLRFIATASGIERMYGMKFTNLSSKSFDLLNNNINSIAYYPDTKSLWASSLYDLQEIVFRDDAHEIIKNNIVHYNNIDISTKISYEKNIYFILDVDVSSNLAENTNVFINKNQVYFGFVVDHANRSIVFNTDLLISDEVEVETSNRFVQIHDFNQSAIEKSIKGEKRRSINKLDRTTKGQMLLLSNLDKPEILLFNDQQITNLPFTTLMLDRDPPFGCLEKLDIISRTIIRFRILAFDDLSGLDGLILSNYENFTSDGSLPLEFQAPQTVIDHDIGSSINNVTDSLIFEPSVTIGTQEYVVGSGSALATWTNNAVQNNFLYTTTDKQAIVFRYNPTTDSWTAIQTLDANDPLIVVTGIKTIFNIIFVCTGTASIGGVGRIYQSVDGENFDLVGSVTGSHARGIAGTTNGTIFFGSNDGTIYELKNDILSIKYQNVGQSIYSLDVFGDTLIVGTGDNGRIYIVDLITDSNLIVFDGPESVINEVYVDSQSGKTMIYAASSNSSTIYRGNVTDYDFVKSYNSFNKNINKIKTILTSVLHAPGEIETDTLTVVASIGDSLFKYTGSTWEFFYKHDEEIKDFIQFSSKGIDGIWIVSNSHVTKWTAVLDDKTVYLRLKDKAGNISSQPITSPACPTGDTTICCNYAYALNIADLKNFINESRIIDITEYGEVVFTYDSPNQQSIFSADKIDEEVGIYTSEVFNGSNDLVSWKTITWESFEPTGTGVDIQLRSGDTSDEILGIDWSDNLVKDASGNVSIEYLTDQYIQFRIILRSRLRDLSPTLSSVTLRNLTAQASHFFTTNFVMPSRPIKGLLTTNTFIPITADIIFGINTNNSVNFGDYQIIEPNRLFNTTHEQFGSNLRIGAKLLSPGIPQIQPSNNPNDPYDASSYICTVNFNHINTDLIAITYHFRIKFYNDPYRTQLIHTFFTGNSPNGWRVGGNQTIFPSDGVTLSPNESVHIDFSPNDLISSNQKWYITVDAWDGSAFETVSNDKSYICSSCNIVTENGLVGEYYRSGIAGDISTMPDFSHLFPDIVCTENIVSFGTSGSWTSTGCGQPIISNHFAVRLRGKIQTNTSGVYKFILTSKDGSILFINGTQIISMNAVQSVTSSSSSIELTVGLHDIEIDFFNKDGDPELDLQWTIPGDINPTQISTSRLFHAVATEYCDDNNAPRLLNFAVLFELENGETVKINLNQ